MTSGEVAGYVASLLVFATFYMKTMLPLRVVAMASNVAFITYALIDGLTPILILHTALLPLNALRLLQLRELTGQVEKAARKGDFSIDAMLPLMRRQRFAAGETLFSKGDPADQLYYVLEGTIFLPSVQQTVNPGSFLGEFGLFSEAGVRTGSAIARTDGSVMVLTRSAVFACLLQHPQLGVHLLRLITGRMMQNAGIAVAEEADGPTAKTEGARPGKGLRTLLLGRTAPRVTIAVVSVVLLVAVVHQPLYVVLERNAAVTTWFSTVTAPITGTIEGFQSKVGDRVDGGADIARIENFSADRSGVIRAEGLARRAEAKVAQLAVYEARLAKLADEWTARRTRYGLGFARDLDLKIEDLELRMALLKDRVELAEVSAARRRTLRASGTGSQADEEVARSSKLELQTSLQEMDKTLERTRHRRRLAADGVYLQEDGKEPEWSWRSLDEIHIEAARAARALSEAREELATATAVLEGERRNLETAARAVIRIPGGMTIWSSRVSNNASVKQGDELFSWIDCSALLVDAPVTETVAALLSPGMPAEVILEGEQGKLPAVVLLSRGASSRLGASELVSLSHGHRAGTAQVIVALADPQSIRSCPIGRRAFVSFPQLRLVDYVRAYIAM